MAQEVSAETEAELAGQLDAEKSTCAQLRKELAEADAQSRHADEKASLEQAQEARIAELETELASAQQTGDGTTASSVEVEAAAMPVRYKAVAAGVIRKAVDKSSDKVGKLEVGEVIEVLSTEDAGGIMRVEFDRGWTSVTAGNGKVLLELVTDEDDTAAP